MSRKTQDTETFPLQCCLYICGKGTDEVDGKKVYKTMVGGVIISDKPLVTFPNSKEDDQEMWMGSILIFPNEKYYGYCEQGLRIDQMLCGGYARPESWKGKLPKE